LGIRKKEGAEAPSLKAQNEKKRKKKEKGPFHLGITSKKKKGAKADSLKGGPIGPYPKNNVSSIGGKEKKRGSSSEGGDSGGTKKKHEGKERNNNKTEGGGDGYLVKPGSPPLERVKKEERVFRPKKNGLLCKKEEEKGQGLARWSQGT